MNTKNIKTYTCFEEWCQEKEMLKEKNRNKKIPWRKILKSMGYHKHTSLGDIIAWVNPDNGVYLVESLIPSSSVIDYVKKMENYYEEFDSYYIVWIEGEE